MFEKTQDAQKLYQHLCNDYTFGTTADVAIEALEKEITNMTLDDKWNKTIESFLDTWNHKIFDLETLQDRSVPDHKKRRWLTATIRSKTELYSAVTNAQTIEYTMFGMGGEKKKLGWEQFYNLIRSQAIVIDSQRPPKFQRKAKKGKQKHKDKGKDSYKESMKARFKELDEKFKNDKWHILSEK